VVFTVSSLQALQFQYIILIPYILDDYKASRPVVRVALTTVLALFFYILRSSPPPSFKRLYENYGETVERLIVKHIITLF
jgi:hypothetical protein